MQDRAAEHAQATPAEPRDVGGKVNAIIEAAEAAAKIREAAQRKADELERDVGQRHETLQREAKMLEARKQRVLESLRDVAAQLQDALVEPAEAEESLVDALDVERRR